MMQPHTRDHRQQWLDKERLHHDRRWSLGWWNSSPVTFSCYWTTNFCCILVFSTNNLYTFNCFLTLS